MTEIFARGGGGGGHASSGGRASSARSSSSKSSSKASASKPSYGKSTAKPGAKIKVGGKTVKTSTAKPANKTFTNEKGIIGDNGYKPHFTGYTAPAGSVVYYPHHSATDYFFWAYIFSNSSPHNDQAVVVQPDGRQVQAQPQKGVDGMLIFNWIVLVLVALAVIGGIVWLVNKMTRK